MERSIDGETLVHYPTSSSPTDTEGEAEWEEGGAWQGERCEPLGAATEGSYDDYDVADTCEMQRLRALEEEQEILSTSLFSLTSHLAQVQFRLRQIVEAPAEDKEKMLMSLEEFIFRGVPDLGALLGTGANPTYPDHSNSCQECSLLDEKLKDQRDKQVAFIEQLRKQLQELDEFSKNEKTSGMSKRERIQHKNNMMNDLKECVSHTLKEGWQHPFTKEELQHQVECDKGGGKVYTQDIISQLQGQVEDMEKFINSLKNGSLKLPTELQNKDKKVTGTQNEKCESRKCKINSTSKRNEELRAETVNLMKKIVSLLHMFAASQFGCSPNVFHKNDLKRMNIINHWGDLRARLEMSIEAVVNLVKHTLSRPNSAMDNYDSDSEESSVTLPNVPLTTAVRKHLALNIRDLMQHGLHPISGDMNTIVPFIACFPTRGSDSKHMHAWDLILKFYQINNGDSYNSTPARKLSESFNLDIVGGTAISNKQSMLSAIGAIVASHKPYKRNHDSHFKAFICAGLNANKLVAWLNLLFKNKTLIQLCYSSTSYVTNTGFQDSLQSLDRLTPYKFDLPVDLAVRQFQNIKDVFM